MQMGTLRVFCDVVETGSFSRAAQKNHRARGNTSELFQALEDEFGVQLAARNSRRFQLTPAGEVCHAHCREILRLDRELDRQMQRARDISANIFDLAACFSFGLHQLQPILRHHRRTFPHIQIQDCYAHIDRVHELVLDSKVDIGLVAYPRRLPGLAVQRVRDEPLALVCHSPSPNSKLICFTFLSNVVLTLHVRMENLDTSSLILGSRFNTLHNCGVMFLRIPLFRSL
jgi:DNA-binding transcriptional LysR family regulator